jgi:sugar lactone lactonase YvrE
MEMGRRDATTAVNGRILSGRRLGVVIAMLALLAICAAGAMGARQQTQATGSAYKVVGHFGKEGTANGQFSTIVNGLATDTSGNVYVADGNNHRIQAFSSQGGFKTKLAFDQSEPTFDVAAGASGDVWGTTQVGAQVRRFPGGGGAPENLSTPKSAEGIAVDADGNVYVSTNGDSTHSVVRFQKTAAGWGAATMWVGGGLQEPGDVEASADGSIYVADRRGSPPNVKRYDASGKLLKSIRTGLQATAGAGAQYGIAVDPDCNLWMTNIPQRRVERYSPSGKLLGTATSGDMVAPDLALGPKGDLYVFDINTRSVVHFAEDRSKPGAATVLGQVVVSKGVAKISYSLPGVSCPAQITATASLAGKGISGRTAVTVAAGNTTVITIPVKASRGKKTATFKIVLQTNGRTTTETRRVVVSVH